MAESVHMTVYFFVLYSPYARIATLMPVTHTQETGTRNWNEKFISFLHRNNSPANHIAWFVSHTDS